MDELSKNNLISAKEASEFSGYNSDYLSRLARSGKIVGKRIGHSWFIDKNSLTTFLSRQVGHNIDRARALARAREVEYKKLHSTVSRAVRTLTKPILVPEKFGLAVHTLRSHALALSVAFAVVVSGAYAAQSSTLSNTASQLASLIPVFASGFKETFGDIPTNIAEKIHAEGIAISKMSERTASPKRTNFEISYPIIADFTIPATTFQLAEKNILPFFAQAEIVQSPSLSLHDLQSSAQSVLAFIASPSVVYRALGDVVYKTLFASLSAYQSLIQTSGDRTLALAIITRDAVTTMPHLINQTNFAIGSFIISASHSAINADVSLAYLSAHVAPKIAEAIFNTEYAGAQHFVAIIDSVKLPGIKPVQLPQLAFKFDPQDALLGLIGKGAVAVNSQLAAVAQTLSAGEQIALATYTTIHGFINSIGSSLAFLFTPTPTVVTPITPKQPVIVVTTPTPPRTYPLPITTSNSYSYPTYQTIAGISPNVLSQSLSSLRTDLLNTVSGMLAARDTSNTIYRYSNTKVVFTDIPFISATEAKFTTLSSNYATIGSALFGSVNINGTLSALGPITAPYFTATSTTDASSFNQLLVLASTTLQNFTAVNSTTTNATTTSLFATTASSTNLFAQTAALGMLHISGVLTDDSLATFMGGFISNASSTITSGLFRMDGGASTTNLSINSNLWVGGNATTTSNGTFTTNGSIGVGTTSPSQLLSVSGSGYFTGGLGVGIATTTPGVLQTSGNAWVGGDLTVIGNSTTLGASSADSLTINSAIKSNLIPDQNITYDLGSTGLYWKNVYVGTLTANNISAASTTIGGTKSNTFTINSDNATADYEDMSLIFFRGVVVPNAILSWNSATSSKRFEFNQPLYIANGSASTTEPLLVLSAVAGHTGNLFNIASSLGSSLFSVGANGNASVAGNLSITGTSTFTGGLSFTSASTSQLSVFNKAYFGGTATSTFDSTGALTLATPLAIASGGMGTTTWITNSIPYFNGTYFTSNNAAINFDGTRFNTTFASTTALTSTGSAYFATLGGSVGIGTTSPSTKFSVGGAAGDTTGHGYFTGGLGVGVVNTVAGTFQTTGAATFGGAGTFNGGLTVNGLCVAADTKLRRRRRRKDGSTSLTTGDPYDYDEPDIVDIKEGDEIQSLDEKTGELVWSRVKQLAFMGVKQTYKLVTASGKTIRTTANHPYLARHKKPTPAHEGRVWENCARSVAVFIDFANIKAWYHHAHYERINLELLQTALVSAGVSTSRFYYGTDERNEKQGKFFAKVASFGFAVITKPVQYLRILFADLLKRPTNLRWLESISPQMRTRIEDEFRQLDQTGIVIHQPKANFDVEIAIDALRTAHDFDTIILFSGDGDFAQLVNELRSRGKRVIVVAGKDFLSGNLALSATRHVHLEALAVAIPGLFYSQMEKEVDKKPTPAHEERVWENGEVSIADLLGLSSVKQETVDNLVKQGESSWLKVAQLKEGMEIAIAAPQGGAVWDRIVSVEPIALEDVYDIEIEGTHNFIGNDIVAHNTAFVVDSTTHNVGIGTTSPTTQLSVQGNQYTSGTSFFGGAITATSTLTLSNFTGILSSNGASGVSARTLTGTANQITVANGDGTGGNPTFSLPSLLAFTQASTSQLSVTNKAYFGGTATSTFDSAGALTLITPLLVSSGGTGVNTFTSSQLLYGNGTNALSSVATTSATLGLGLSGALTTIGTSQSLSIATSSLYTGAANALPYFSGTNTLGSINAGTAGYVLAMSGGTPTWIASTTLATISGTLATANGGTSATTLTGLLQGNGTGAITGITGTAGQFPYYNGASTLLATSTIFLSTSGNIGIGDTAPGTKLSVVGNAQIGYAGGTTVSAGTSLAISGNVGIGTTSPLRQLQMTSTALIGTVSNVLAVSPQSGSGTNDLWLGNDTAPTTGTGASLVLGGRYRTGDNDQIGYGAIAGIKENVTSSNFAGALAFYTTTQAASTIAERMRIDSTGNVGIGTTNPTSSLHVVVPTSSDKVLRLERGGPGNVGDMEFGLGDYGGGYQGRLGAMQLSFEVNKANGAGLGAAPAMFIKNDGNVGIGTTSPSALLAVQGNSYVSGTSFFGGAITATSTLTVQGTGNSSFVGNVGIGTTVPSERLTVVGTSALGYILKVGDGSAETILADNYTSTESQFNIGMSISSQKSVISSGVKVSTTTDNVYLSSQGQYAASRWAMTMGGASNPHFNLLYAPSATVTNGSPVTMSTALTVDTSGNVGIGTTSPSGTLHVYAASQPRIILDRANTGSGALQLFSTANVTDWSMGVGASGSDFGLYAGGATNVFSAISSGAVANSLVIKAGNVGIGTTSPSALLAVQGNSYVSGTSFFGGAITATSTLTVQGTGNSSFVGNVGIGTTSPWGKLSVTGAGTGTGISFLVADSANSPKMVVLDSGNVGIGTTTPLGHFAIGGTDTSTYFTEAPNAYSGMVGWHINKNVGGTHPDPGDPHGISWDVNGVPIWEMGMDYQNQNMVLLYEAQQGDQMRAGAGGRISIGPSIGDPSGNTSQVYIRGKLSSETFGATSALALATDGPGNPQLSLIQITAASNNTAISFGNGKWTLGSSQLYGGVDQNFSIYDVQAASIRLLIDSAGNVGIGTTSPGVKLSVAGGGLFNSGITSYGSLSIPSFSATSTTATSTISGFLDVLGTGSNATSTYSGNLWVKGALQVGGGSIHITTNSVSSTDGALSLSSVGNSNLTNQITFGGKVLMTGLTSDALTIGIPGVMCLSAGSEVLKLSGVSTCIVSSARFKHDIATSTAGLAEVLAMRPVSFTYNGDTGSQTVGSQLGFIAEEVDKIDPRLVVYDTQGLPFSVRYENYTAVLTSAIQELDARTRQMMGPDGVLSIVPGVESQCVTGDTKLRRRKKKDKNEPQNRHGDVEFDEICIRDIAVGDEIQSLDERTNTVVYSRVSALIDMGEQEVFELVTKSGRRIRTTSNHPFLARAGATQP